MSEWAEIRELIKNDDPYALTLIYDLLGQKLFGYALGMVNSKPDAEDIVQDLFIKIVEQRNKIAGAENISAYIFRMAGNLAMDCLRKRQKEKNMLFESNFLLVKDGIENREEYEKDLSRLQHAVAGLPPDQKAVVFMHYFRDMTFDEIAGLLNTSINTVASRCRYGLEKLKMVWGKMGKDKKTINHGLHG
jgi:RNA polymerase sigma-70 factor (ECF subfamily)